MAQKPGSSGITRLSASWMATNPALSANSFKAATTKSCFDVLREASRKRERSGLLVTERLDAVDPERVEHRNVEAIGRRVRREFEEPPGGELAACASPDDDRQVLVIIAGARAIVFVVHLPAVVEERHAVRFLSPIQ